MFARANISFITSFRHGLWHLLRLLALMHAAVKSSEIMPTRSAGPKSKEFSALTALIGVTLNAAYTINLEEDYGSYKCWKNMQNFYCFLSDSPLEVESIRK